MSTNNFKIADQYSSSMAKITKPGGQWVSTNLPYIKRNKIVKIYRKYWDIVEYSDDSQVCVCRNPKQEVA